MQNNGRPFPSPCFYRLPEHEFVKLQRLRTQWAFLASAFQAHGAEEDRVPLEVSRSMMAQGFAQFAQQLGDVLNVVETMPPRRSRGS